MPKRLNIRLLAVSGRIDDRHAARRAIERLQAAGHTVHEEGVCERVHLRFAGTDEQRAADINALADPRQALPDVALATCGGYGAITLLDRLDYDGLRQRLGGGGCVLVGHGDFTTLQCALYARSGVPSLHGPMLVPDFGPAYLREPTWRHFWDVLQSDRTDMSWLVPEATAPLDVEGTLWGGNLSALCSLLGTPYLPRVEGGLLYVEEKGEQTFRVERMLYELKLAGVLDGQRAILLGRLDGQRVSEYDNGYDIEHALDRFSAATGVPLVRALAFGQVEDKWTLPFGSPARLTVHDGTATLAAWGYPHAGGAPGGGTPA